MDEGERELVVDWIVGGLLPLLMLIVVAGATAAAAVQVMVNIVLQASLAAVTVGQLSAPSHELYCVCCGGSTSTSPSSSPPSPASV